MPNQVPADDADRSGERMGASLAAADGLAGALAAA
jgi:hypothetical protein